MKRAYRIRENDTAHGRTTTTNELATVRQQS